MSLLPYDHAADAICVRPRAFKLQKPASDNPNVWRSDFHVSWGWVPISDLTECIAAIHKNRGAAGDPYLGLGFDCRDYGVLLSKFNLLNKRSYHPVSRQLEGLFTWISDIDCGLHEPQIHPTCWFDFRTPRPLEQVFIPQLWADLIIEMVEQGVTAVVAKESPGSTPERPMHDLWAIFKDGSSKWLHWKGSQRYVIVG